MHAPLVLRLIAALFVLAGVVAGVNIAAGLVDPRVVLDFNALGLWIGPGLLRGDPRARRWARWFVLLIGFGACLVVVAAMPPDGGEIWVLGQHVGSVGRPVLLPIAAALLGLSGWLWHVLARPDVAAHFGFQE